MLISCISLPPATISSVPINDFAKANEELANVVMEQCCGKSICGGCIHSFCKSGNIDNCPYCRADKMRKTVEEKVEELMKRAEANNDAAAKFVLGSHYYRGLGGLQQDHAKAMELYSRAAELGCSASHNNLAGVYHERGDMKKAMAGHEVARNNL